MAKTKVVRSVPLKGAGGKVFIEMWKQSKEIICLGIA